MMRDVGTAGTFRGKIVYKYDTMFDYLSDVGDHFNNDYYGLVDSTKLCYGHDQVGEVTWGKEGNNDVVIFNKPKSLYKKQPERGQRAKAAVVEEVVKVGELDQADIELVSIEDIIKEIRSLKIEFDNSPVI